MVKGFGEEEDGGDGCLLRFLFFFLAGLSVGSPSDRKAIGVRRMFSCRLPYSKAPSLIRKSSHLGFRPILNFLWT